MEHKKLTKTSLKALRELIDKQGKDEIDGTDRALYNILGAIRGPDQSDEDFLKPITIAIRRYIGFREKNCSGRLWMGCTKFNFENLLDIILEPRSLYGSHYRQHLKYAIRAIGRKELLRVAFPNA